VLDYEFSSIAWIKITCFEGICHLYREEKQSQIYTVSSLTSEIKSLLEERYPFVWIQGEISNLSKPSSGHLYFTLKDSRSQISAIIFRNLAHHLKFKVENGLQVTGMARLSLYEPRGTYQVVFEFLEPKGAGALQLAFEQLKARLAQEGLFDAQHKKKIPYLPERISVITSPTGAVIHDIMNIIDRRFPSVILEVVPVKVQGDQAEQEISSAVKMLNKRGLSDLIIIARGGGSLEDLAAFNSETVARAVFSSEIPVVSAVGHETDYTICDFVADLRAPTPSAAAELVVPVKKELIAEILKLRTLLTNRMSGRIEKQKNHLIMLSKKIIDPKRRINDLRMTVEDNTQRLIRIAHKTIDHKKDLMSWRVEKLFLFNPLKKNREYKVKINHLNDGLTGRMTASIQSGRIRLNELTVKLEALSPLSILERGYSVTRTIPGMNVVTSPVGLVQDQELEVILSRGSLRVGLKGIIDHGEKEI
jgi:exodeoxyribonuclease VII large subunit